MALLKPPPRHCSLFTDATGHGYVLIETVGETGSTSADLAARLRAAELVEEGQWLIADRQTAGHGRQGRVWADGEGNFMGSTVVHLHLNDPAAHTLSLVAGVAAFKAIEGVAPGLTGLVLKWPNDVLIVDAKLAGILLERIADTVVVGIGVNLAQAPQVPDRCITSLAAHGHSVRRDEFAIRLAASWAQALQSWHQGAWEWLRAEWLSRAHSFGTPLKVHGADGSMLAGTFAGLTSEGALQLQLSSGTRHTIHAGEVVLDRRC